MAYKLLGRKEETLANLFLIVSHAKNEGFLSSTKKHMKSGN